MKDTVSNQQLYEAIMNVHQKIDEVVDQRIVPLERWQSRIMGQVATIMFVVTLSINIFIEYIKDKVFKKI